MSRNYVHYKSHKLSIQQSEPKVTICIYEIDKELISIICKELKQTGKKRKEVNEILENLLG